MKQPKLTLKEGPMTEHPYMFTIEEEEAIKKEYELEKEKETSKTRQVLVKMIRIKALGSIRSSGQAVEESEEATEEEFQDEEIPEEVDDEDENEELLEALQQALNTDEEVETEQEPPVELKKVVIFTVPLMSKQSTVVELAIKEFILYIEKEVEV